MENAKLKNIKVLATILISFLILSLMIISSVFATLYFVQKANIEPPTLQVGGDGSINGDDKNQVQQGEVYDLSNASGVEFMAAEASVEQTLRVQVTFHPFFFKDKRVTWSLAWKNPNSEWATGKNVANYVTCAVDSTNSTIATITEKQPFGETVVATITPLAAPSKAIHKDIDYVGGVVNYEASFKYNNKTYYFSKDSVSGGDEGSTNNCLQIKAVKGAAVSDFNVNYYYSDICSKEPVANSANGVSVTLLGGAGYNDSNFTYMISNNLYANKNQPFIPFFTSENVNNFDFLFDYSLLYAAESSKTDIEQDLVFKSFEEYFAGVADDTKHNVNSMLNFMFSRDDFDTSGGNQMLFTIGYNRWFSLTDTTNRVQIKFKV